MSETKTNTTVEQIDPADLDNLLGTPGAGSVVTAASNEPEKPSFFQNGKVDMSVLDGNDPQDPPVDPSENPSNEGEEVVAEPQVQPEPTAFSDLVDDMDGVEGSNAGRPKLDKGGMAQLAKALIDDKVILPFDEDKALEDYTMDDFKELFSLNFQEQRRIVEENTPQEFFQALPEELQYAAQYVASGGTDMKGLFRALASAEETKSLDINHEKGQESIVRNYLRATNFGDDAEIQEEIDSWKDLDKLEAKAKQFKPKLDKMQEAVVQRQIKEQEVKRRQQEEAAHNYANSIYETLARGELGGLKLTEKTQHLLYNGLIQPNYPSVSGQNTNLFGHLIEKHQFVEPNHELIAEALWLLANPAEYRAAIRQGAKNEVAEETARQLKIEQASKTAGGSGEEPGTGRTSKSRSIKRPDKNFFKR